MKSNLWSVYRVYEREGKNPKHLVQRLLIQAADEKTALQIAKEEPAQSDRDMHNLLDLIVEPVAWNEKVIMHTMFRWAPDEVVFIRKNSDLIKNGKVKNG